MAVHSKAYLVMVHIQRRHFTTKEQSHEILNHKVQAGSFFCGQITIELTVIPVGPRSVIVPTVTVRGRGIRSSTHVVVRRLVMPVIVVVVTCAKMNELDLKSTVFFDSI